MLPTTLLTALFTALPTTTLQATQSPGQVAAQATNHFGIELYRALGDEQRGNLVFSPYSIAIALTMAAEGARDATAAEMVQVLHVPPTGSLADLHAAYAAQERRFRGGGGDASPATQARIEALRQQLQKANDVVTAANQFGERRGMQAAGERAEALAAQLNTLLSGVNRYELRVANALWVEQSFPLLPAYVATIDRFYGSGGANRLDLRNKAEAARATINQWVEARTERRIAELLPPGSVTSAARLLLTNAVFFRGEWDVPFQANLTTDGDFVLGNGTLVRAKMLRDRQRASIRYAAFRADGSYFATPHEVSVDAALRPETYPGTAGFMMIELPYKGGEVAMVVLAPCAYDGLARVEQLLSADRLAGWTSRLEARTVDTALPRFQQRSACEVSRALQSMGMLRAFRTPLAVDGAQFGGMSDATDPQLRLSITAVHHQAAIEVTEVGTVAAAATAVAVSAGASMAETKMVPFHPVFRADRPFLFLLRDTKSGAILFLGRVTDPRE